jgi:mannosyltransferase OCH1-like enzyme
MPARFEDYGRTWLQHHPDWRMVLWTDGILPSLEHQDAYDAAEELTAGNVWQLRSDIVRYEVLWRYGGVYADCDFECLRSIEPLIEGVESFAAWEEQAQWIANGLMGCTPRHWFLRALLDGLAASIDSNRTQRPNRSTGPQYLTRMYRAHGGLDTVLDQHLIFPYSYRDLDRVGRGYPNEWDCYLVHHWSNQRARRGLA